MIDFRTSYLGRYVPGVSGKWRGSVEVCLNPTDPRTFWCFHSSKADQSSPSYVMSQNDLDRALNTRYWQKEPPMAAYLRVSRGL